jgi:hypothetical protein
MVVRALAAVLLMTVLVGCSKRSEPNVPAAATPAGASHVEEARTAPSAAKPAATATADESVADRARKQATLDFALLEGEYIADPDGQWVASYRASTVYGYMPDSPAAQKLLQGPPDNQSWQNTNLDVGVDWVVAEFPKAVSATALRVVFHEHYGNRSITKVELLAEDGNFHTMWSGLNEDPDETRARRTWFIRQFQATPYKAKGVRLTFANSLERHLKGVDAIQLVGR